MKRRKNSKRSKRQRKLRGKPKKNESRGRYLSIVPFGWKIFLTIGAILGFWSAFYSLAPSLSVTPQTPLDLQNPFTTPFVVSNDGFLPVYSVVYSCSTKNVEDANRNRVSIVSAVTGRIDALRINTDEKQTIRCPFPVRLSAPIQRGEITLTITFRSSWIPWDQEKRFHFVAARNSNGHIIWFPQPGSD